MKTAVLNSILKASPDDAWNIILNEVWGLFTNPANPVKAEVLITKDKKIGKLDTLLSGSAWELWSNIPHSENKTSSQLKNFWANNADGKAILILDAFSLREACWILSQASDKGFQVMESKATLAEIPGDTTPFAKALGFNQRSSLTDNGASSSDFSGAFTESEGLPFQDCCNLIKPEPNIIFWHHWPDNDMHTYADNGNGAQMLTRASEKMLSSDGFWAFIEQLTTGRKLVITGDHGYANSGLFRDLAKKEQIDYMKKLFKSGRSTQNNSNSNHKWAPPLTLNINGNVLALGRRKWKSQGGYPTLTHGGLSLLEMAVPFIQIERK